jgi:hypothetical protein
LSYALAAGCGPGLDSTDAASTFRYDCTGAGDANTKAYEQLRRLWSDVSADGVQTA